MQRAILLFSLIIVFPKVFSQNIIYVDSSASGLNNGSSWANAYNNLNSALLNSNLLTDTIRIARGTYKPSIIPANAITADPRDVSFYLKNGIALVGGYSTGGDQFDPKLNPTILSGDIGIAGDSLDNSYHVLICLDINLDLFGLTVEMGNGNGIDSLLVGSLKIPRNEGGGIFISNSSIGLFSMIMRNNYSYLGGAVVGKNANMEIYNTVFRQNNSFRGGGIYSISGSFTTIINAVFYENIAQQAGGAFLTHGSNFTIDHSTFVSNGAGVRGGTILNILPNGNRISNSVFTLNYVQTTNNITAEGADIYDSASLSEIRHSLLQLYRTCDNCIFTQNAQLEHPEDGDGPDNVWATSDDGITVTPISDAFKTGRNGYIFTDINNKPRSSDAKFDMGAYENGSMAFIQGNTIYVDSSATGSNNGSSWANALISLQAAVNIAAASNGNIDTLKIAKGTYNPSSLPRGINFIEPIDYSQEQTFHLPGNLVLIGGYSSGGNIRNSDIYETILMSESFHVVTAAYVPNIILDGLIIKGGNANGPGNLYVNSLPHPRNSGGGILALNTNLELINCKVLDGKSSTYGGGMTCSASLLKIKKCFFSNNYGGDGAGGLYLLLLEPGSSIKGSTFHENSSWQLGGAIYIKTNPNLFLIDSCSFKNNFTTVLEGNVAGGGGIFSNEGANIKVTNSVFDGNRAHLGAGIQVTNDASSVIKNCIFINGVASRSGGGVSTRSFYNVTLINCIFLRNQAAYQGGGFNSQGPSSVDNCLFYENAAVYGGGAVMDMNSDLTIKNSLFYRNLLNGTANVEGSDVTTTGSFFPYFNLFQVYTHPNIYNGNMLGADPKFSDTSDFDGPDNIWGTGDDGLRLDLQSPLINEGKSTTDYTLVDIDITGGPRIRDRYGDIGPYESNFCLSSGFVNKTVYVDSSIAGGQQTGKSWENAFNSLEDAFRVKRCGCDIDTIKIAEGTYVPKSAGGINPNVPYTSKSDFVFYFPDSVTVLGGYPMGGGERNYKVNQTILSGYDPNESFPNKAHVAFFSYTNKLVIDGLIIEQGGFGPGDPNQYIDEELITRNDGKGLYAVGSKFQIQNCIVRNNIDGDGALKFVNCAGEVKNTVFEKNYCQGMTAVAYNQNSAVKYIGCIFSGNSNPSGGSNCVYLNGNTFPSLINCTFVNNYNSNAYSVITSDWGYQTPFISNCIFWANGLEIGISGSLDNRYSFTLFEGYPGTTNSITGIFPSFVDMSDPDGPDNLWGTADDGLRLQNTSVAINNGHNDSIPSYIISDISGNPRINGGVIDMGAYECSCTAQGYINKLVPFGTVETTTDTGSNCGTWKFINSPVENSKYIIEIDKNGNVFNPSSISIDVTTNQDHQRSNGADNTTLGFRMVSIAAPGLFSVNNGVGLRIYFDSTEFMSLPGSYRSWFKHPGSSKSAVLSDLTFNRLQNAIPIIPTASGKVNGISYVEFNGITSFSTFGYLTSTSNLGVLPVTFLFFNAVRHPNLNRGILTWKTTKEMDNLVYEIQRSDNGIEWITIGKVLPGKSDYLVRDYEFIDEKPLTEICFYRIKQIDLNGKSSYSVVRKLEFSFNKYKTRIIPNPANHFINLISDQPSPMINYKIIDISGRIIIQGKHTNTSLVTVDISKLSRGIYWISINGIVQKLIVGNQ